jgi:hypothetical protein
MQDPPARHRLSPRLDDLRDGHLPQMTQEGMFFLGVVLGMLLHAVIKVFIGLIKMALLAL